MKKNIIIISLLVFSSCIYSKKYKSSLNDYSLNYTLYSCKGADCLRIIIKKKEEIFVSVRSFCDRGEIVFGVGHSVTEIKNDSTYYHNNFKYDTDKYEYTYRPISNEEKKILRHIKDDLEKVGHCNDLEVNNIIGFIEFGNVKNNSN